MRNFEPDHVNGKLHEDPSLIFTWTNTGFYEYAGPNGYKFVDMGSGGGYLSGPKHRRKSFTSLRDADKHIKKNNLA